MTPETIRLKIRYLLCQLEQNTASANMETARGGEWCWDHTGFANGLCAEVDALFEQLQKLEAE